MRFKPGDVVIYTYKNPAVDWVEKRYKFKVLEIRGVELFLECMQDIKNKNWESWPKGKTLQLEAYKFKKIHVKSYQPSWL
jgi:hypothetical protein